MNLATYAVGRHLKAVLQKCHTPAYEDDSYNAKLLQLRAKGYMAIPGQGHKDIREHEECYGCYSLSEHNIYYLIWATKVNKKMIDYTVFYHCLAIFRVVIIRNITYLFGYLAFSLYICGDF